MVCGSARSFAITLRPRAGWNVAIHLQPMTKFLATADQYQFYLESVDNDPSTRHVHGRILYNEPHRKDNVQRRLADCYADVMDASEVKCARRGVKFLYSDWLNTYCEENLAKSDTTEYDELTWLHTDDEWVYSTDADKKNAHGFNISQWYLEKAKAYLDWRGDRTSPINKADVLAWHDEQFCLGLAVPFSSPSNQSMTLRYIVVRANYVVAHPEEAESDSEIF